MLQQERLVLQRLRSVRDVDVDVQRTHFNVRRKFIYDADAYITRREDLRRGSWNIWVKFTVKRDFNPSVTLAGVAVAQVAEAFYGDAQNEKKKKQAMLRKLFDGWYQPARAPKRQ